VKVVRADAEAGEQRLGPGFKIVAAAVLKFLHRVAVAFEQRLHLHVCHGLAHGRFHLAHLLSKTQDLA
jgi:hypothetical protein